MSDLKEPDFFVTELNWGRGVRWYEQQFVGADGAVAVGEASTSYSKYPLYRDVPSRIADTIPDVRLIYLIRQPIERIRSQYLHQRLLREERRTSGPRGLVVRRFQPVRDADRSIPRVLR
jgi:hypothetical protein